jgi:hypothetical protein
MGWLTAIVPSWMHHSRSPRGQCTIPEAVDNPCEPDVARRAVTYHD